VTAVFTFAMTVNAFVSVPKPFDILVSQRSIVLKSQPKDKLSLKRAIMKLADAAWAPGLDCARLGVSKERSWITEKEETEGAMVERECKGKDSANGRGWRNLRV